MCYSASISFVFALVGLSTALWIYLDPRQKRLILLPLLFYTVMIQSSGYPVKQKSIAQDQ
jgi:hypothetical protein